MGFRDLAEPMSGVEADERNSAEDRPDRSPLTTYRAAAVETPPTTRALPPSPAPAAVLDVAALAGACLRYAHPVVCGWAAALV